MSNASGEQPDNVPPVDQEEMSLTAVRYDNVNVEGLANSLANVRRCVQREMEGKPQDPQVDPFDSGIDITAVRYDNVNVEGLANSLANVRRGVQSEMERIWVRTNGLHGCRPETPDQPESAA